MILFPAIDLKDGACVRLLRGEMSAATVFNDDPAAQARDFAAAGFDWLHVVDLDGAFAGRSVNGAAVAAIVAATTLPMQLGGGIRDAAQIDAWLELGHRPRRARHRRAARSRSGQDARAAPIPAASSSASMPARGRVAVEGWAETSEVAARELALRFEDAGVAAIVYTDIDRDGALAGVNVEATAALASASDDAGHRLGRRRLARRSRGAEGARGRAASPASSAAARSMTGGSIPRGARGAARADARVPHAEDARHPLPRRQGRARRQGRQFRRSRRCRRSRSSRRGSTTARAPTSCASSTSRRATRSATTLYDVVRRTAEQCFMPLTVGGGVRDGRGHPPPAARRRRQGVDQHRGGAAPGFRARGGREIRQPMHRRRDRRQSGPAPERWEVFTHGGRRADRHRRGRLGAPHGGARRRRDPADLDGPRRHQIGLRHRADARRRRCGHACRSSPRAASARSIIWSTAFATATPRRCSPPRSSISAPTGSARPRRISPPPASRCGHDTRP